jgi:hypothetical protein
VIHRGATEHRTNRLSDAAGGNWFALGKFSIPRVWSQRKNNPAGVAIVGAFSWGGQTMASVTGYFYGADAGRIAAASEPRWKAWLQETSGASQSG